MWYFFRSVCWKVFWVFFLKYLLYILWEKNELFMLIINFCFLLLFCWVFRKEELNILFEIFFKKCFVIYEKWCVSDEIYVCDILVLCCFVFFYLWEDFCLWNGNYFYNGFKLILFFCLIEVGICYNWLWVYKVVS